MAAAARRARGAIFRADETGLRSDDVRGRSYAPRGRTPVVRVCRKRAGLSLISAVSNRGEVRWMVLDGAVKAPTLIRFFRRLIRDARCKLFLILDRLPVSWTGCRCIAPAPCATGWPRIAPGSRSSTSRPTARS